MTTAVKVDKDAVVQAGLADPEHHGISEIPATARMDVQKKPALQEQNTNTTTGDGAHEPISFDDAPSEEDLRTLRRVSGKIKWGMYTIAFAELCERFSYYGSSVLYTNFVTQPLPPGSDTGAAKGSDGQAGALGLGNQTGQAINLLNQFLTYLLPLLGAWIADAKLGRYATIHVAIGIATVAHAILVAASAPHVIVHPNSALAAFIIGMLALCTGSGFFKANVSPLLAEQNEDTRMRVEVRKGERVIVDPAVTNTRIFLYYYFAINIGAVTGQIGMVYVEKYVGYWVAFLIPTALFLACPFVLAINKPRYRLTPPTGSILSRLLRMLVYVSRRSRPFRPDWDLVKPSNVPPERRPSWMTYDDAWVDEVRRGLMACRVFLFLPIYFLAYNQMTGNLTTQASTLQLHGTPNDVIQNLDPISVIALVPIIDHGLYPGLRRVGILFTPMQRMTTGFFISAMAMVAAAVMQYYIYQKGPCGWHANGDGCEPAPINVWAQCVPYILIGLSEIFTNVTSYEYAFSKAPENMKSLVMSVNLAMSAISAAIGQAFTPMSKDPLLIWNYTTVACIAAAGGAAFWLCFHHLDAQEDMWNSLQKSEYVGRTQPNAHVTEKTDEVEV